MSRLDRYANLPLDERLRQAVAQWRARHGVSARRFGIKALGDPIFVYAHTRGRSVQLATADRVLAFMGHPPLGPVFRREVEAFLTLTGTKVSVLGEEATGDPSFVARLRRGLSPRLRTVDRVRAWMAAHASPEQVPAMRAGVREELFAGTSAPGPLGAPHPSGGSGENTKEKGGTRMSNNNGKNYLSTREASEWLGLSPRTLDRYRVSGGGPAFHRFGGRVRYLLADLEAWASARRRVSTSDDGTAGRREAAR